MPEIYPYSLPSYGFLATSTTYQRMCTCLLPVSCCYWGSPKGHNQGAAKQAPTLFAEGSSWHYLVSALVEATYTSNNTTFDNNNMILSYYGP